MLFLACCVYHQAHDVSILLPNIFKNEYNMLIKSKKLKKYNALRKAIFMDFHICRFHEDNEIVFIMKEESSRLMVLKRNRSHNISTKIGKCTHIFLFG